MRPGLEFLDGVDVDDFRAVDARELLRIKPGLEVIQRVTNQVGSRCGVELDVVFLRRKPKRSRLSRA